MPCVSSPAQSASETFSAFPFVSHSGKLSAKALIPGRQCCPDDARSPADPRPPAAGKNEHNDRNHRHDQSTGYRAVEHPDRPQQRGPEDGHPDALRRRGEQIDRRKRCGRAGQGMGSSVRDSLFLRRPRGCHSKPRPTPAAESLRVLGSRAAFIAERHFLKPRRRAQSLSQSRCAAQRRPPAAGRASTHSGPHPI
jgi:hypothetical protein